MSYHAKTIEKIIFLVFIVVSLLLSANVLASEPLTPKTKVETLFTQVRESLINYPVEQRQQFKVVKSVLTQVILPSFDIRYFCQKVLGKHLTKLDEQQNQQFQLQMTQALINSYSSLLRKYNNESITVTKWSISESTKFATVNVQIATQPKVRQAIIKLINTPQHDWLLFDIIVEGVSLLQTKQGEINSAISKLGVDQTLQKLAEKNSMSSGR